MLIVLCVRSTVPAAATLSNGLDIWRLLVSAMPLAMVKLPPRSLNAVLAPGPWRSSGICARADLADHLGDVDAFDGAVAHGDAALSGQGRLDLVGGGARAADLKRQLGVTFEQAELSGIGQQGLGLDAVDEEVAGEGGHRLGGIEHELAAGVSVIKLHAAQRRIQHAVAEGEAERARPELEMSDAGLAHIEIDVGVEGGRRGCRRRRRATGPSPARASSRAQIARLASAAFPLPARAPARRQ